MRRRFAIPVGLVLICGCRGVGSVESDEPTFAQQVVQSLGDAVWDSVRPSFGDDTGHLFTGEKRGEYRDRKETERLGRRGFRRKHGRDPDLYLEPGSSSW